jgi:hypothetical protein
MLTQGFGHYYIDISGEDQMIVVDVLDINIIVSILNLISEQRILGQRLKKN